MTDEELVEAVKHKLEEQGSYAKFKAEVACEIMNLMGINEIRAVPKPQPPSGIETANELVREYLDWVGYSFTKCVFSAESSSTQGKSRPEIENELGLMQTDGNLPLLLNLVSHIKQNCHEDWA